MGSIRATKGNKRSGRQERRTIRSYAMKWPKLEAKKMEWLDRPAAWCLNVPAKWSDTGKRQRMYFETLERAEGEILSIRQRKLTFGQTLEQLSPARASEALAAYRLLEGHDVSLLDAVTGFLAVHKDRNSSIPFLELFNSFLDAKKDRNQQYLRELRITRDRWPQLHAKLVCDITHTDLDPLLHKLTPGARNPILRYWRAVFNYGIKKGYLTESPSQGLDFERRKRKEVETLTNSQVKAMLEHALAEDLQLLPFLVLGCFAGIRPDGELQKLEWRDIDLTDKVVTIRPEVSKTNRRRFVDLSENAKAWLQALINRAGAPSGRIVQFTESELRARRTANRKAAGIDRWIQQSMRHSYCSNWLAVHKDINRLVLMSGHDSVDTMFRHYHRGTMKADAEQFWSIRPPKRRAAKIVPFAA
jgi:integrase/recombinase XerD